MKPCKPRPRSALAQAQSDPTRHFHIVPDDEAFQVKVHRVRPKSDPLALPVEFFRAGQV